MFENSELHNSNGDWQAIFGVNTLPEYRNRFSRDINEKSN